MAWTAPKTFQATEMLTAAMLNTYLRDNLNETGPAKASTPGGYMVATGLNAIAQRVVETDKVTTEQTRTSSTYGDLSTVGPSVTVTTGTRAIVMTYCRIETATSGALAAVSWAVSGATTRSGGDSYSIMISGISSNQFVAAADIDFITTLNAGSNTFTMKYRSNGAATASFSNRRILVMPS